MYFIQWAARTNQVKHKKITIILYIAFCILYSVFQIILRVADNSLLPENDSENMDLSKTPNSANIGRVLYSFIRKRSQKGFHAYGLTTVKILACGQKVEVK